MRPFRYERPAEPAAAIALLGADPEARFLAGGTNLVDLMRLGVETPPLLVDVRHIVDARIESAADGGLRIGAGATNSELAAHPAVRADYPALSQALLNGASGQLRNLATAGGNLLQRTRCVYFQDTTKPCNKRAPGSGCPARAGEHRNLAVLGHSEHCIATHPSDMAVALSALDAEVEVHGPAGRRRLPVAELHRLPEDHPERDTVLEHGALITAVHLPAAGALTRASAYRKVRERRSYAFALVSVAAAVTVADGQIEQVALAFGGVAHRPWRARGAEARLVGQPPEPAAVRAAVDAELVAAEPLPDNAFKLEILRRVATRTVLELARAADGAPA